ncbi:hypothetical protein L209DRAFT_350202 [Thermothelomyces heterothallicus CBS 203.75]
MKQLEEEKTKGPEAIKEQQWKEPKVTLNPSSPHTPSSFGSHLAFALGHYRFPLALPAKPGSPRCSRPSLSPRRSGCTALCL